MNFEVKTKPVVGELLQLPLNAYTVNLAVYMNQEDKDKALADLDRAIDNDSVKPRFPDSNGEGVKFLSLAVLTTTINYAIIDAVRQWYDTPDKKAALDGISLVIEDDSFEFGLWGMPGLLSKMTILQSVYIKEGWDITDVELTDTSVKMLILPEKLIVTPGILEKRERSIFQYSSSYR